MPLDPARTVRPKLRHGWGRFVWLRSLGAQEHIYSAVSFVQVFLWLWEKDRSSLLWGMIAVNVGCHGE